MIKFLTQPKRFYTPDDAVGYDIHAIGISVPLQELTEVDAVQLDFVFYKKNDVGEYLEHSRVSKPSVPKKVTIPNVGDVDFIAGLMSHDNMNVYNVSKMFGAMYGYTMLPFEQQIFLNK
jgi:hypothetical protein